MYSYGDPNDPLPTDPRFSEMQLVIDAAVEASEKSEEVIAIWDDDNGECTTLVWLGWVYSV